MPAGMPFSRILIANRGEIAIRIIRACRELGIHTIALYSDVDRQALHVGFADEAHSIGGASARESYLDVDKVLTVAAQTRAEAIHPGYGFLSENPAFAEACENRGVVFIGPTAESLHSVGNKIAARRTAQSCGVPVVPGSIASLNGHTEATAIAKTIGYPVLLKAAAGGGGKGMRTATTEAELRQALDVAAREADHAFGDSSLYIEKYVDPARHVEVQLLADHFGNVVHLGERDCSIQRRFQKVIEESPSPAVSDDLRRHITSAAIAIAKAIGYRNAGTVEFLVDGDRFYFIEVNARLQVEHPVTEMVTGIDLVKEQILIAGGLPLRLKQADVSFQGASLQARIYAENPLYNFMPSPGVIGELAEPSGPRIRIDSGIAAGSAVPIEYDGLLAKLVVWGSTRSEAIARMRQALEGYDVSGVHTTIPFKRYVLEHPAFQSGNYDTGFVSSIIEDWKRSCRRT